MLLDGIGRTCLVHSDLNPKNVLVDPGSLEVTGLLDWEFAHAGLPGTDLGNLLRFDRQPPFVGGRGATYRERVPDAGDDASWTWPARPTCSPSSTSPLAVAPTPSPSRRTTCCGPWHAPGTCTPYRQTDGLTDRNQPEPAAWLD